MARIRSLRASQLMHSCSAKELPFRTTDELKPIKGLVGQSQATKRFSLGSIFIRKVTIYLSLGCAMVVIQG